MGLEIILMPQSNPIRGSHPWARPTALGELKLKITSAYDPGVRIEDETLAALVALGEGAWLRAAARRVSLGLADRAAVVSVDTVMMFEVRALTEAEVVECRLAASGHDTNESTIRFYLECARIGSRCLLETGEQIHRPSHVACELGYYVNALTEGRGVEQGDLGNPPK